MANSLLFTAATDSSSVLAVQEAFLSSSSDTGRSSVAEDFCLGACFSDKSSF